MYTPPTNKKPVHLVKHWHQVPEKQRQAEPLWEQEKIDGVYAYGLCILGDNRIFSRTGEHCLSLKHIEAELEDLAASRKFQPFVAIFEVHRPGWTVNQISGAFRRQSEQFTEAVARIHDVIPYDDFVAGRCEIPYRLRYVAADFVSQVCSSFQLIEATSIDYLDVEACAAKRIANGEEGGIFRRENGIWIAGKKDVNVMKVKMEESWDLEVVDWEYGKVDGKYEHTLGKLHCHWRKFGKVAGEVTIVKASGMSDTQRDEWCKDFGLINGRCVKVDAMCITPYGMLREPRFKEVRDDKVEADIK
jgi:hypothetical protein